MSEFFRRPYQETSGKAQSAPLREILLDQSVHLAHSRCPRICLSSYQRHCLHWRIHIIIAQGGAWAPQAALKWRALMSYGIHLWVSMSWSTPRCVFILYIVSFISLWRMVPTLLYFVHITGQPLYFSVQFNFDLIFHTSIRFKMTFGPIGHFVVLKTLS